LSDDDRGSIESAIADLKAAIEPEDADPTDITTKTETLAQAAQKLGEALYKAQQEEAAAASEPGMKDASDISPEAGEENGSTVVDTDFEEVDDEPKDKSA
ncbi:MAG: molecular chaperone DnaK, partial [Pseudomonadota bacterium]|nr:molecular chaperone DnaK [Pseudomonadota bacterium]